MKDATMRFMAFVLSDDAELVHVIDQDPPIG